MAGINVQKMLEGLNKEEREEVLKILGEIANTGESSKLVDLMKVDYEEVPVDIETFITSKEYLGNSFAEEESVYPFWMEELKKIFKDVKFNNYNEIIFTGAIGIGKTTIALIGMCYVLYSIMCLRNPQAYYGLIPNSTITFSFFNITLDLSKGVAFKRLNEMLLKSPWFMARGTMAGTRYKVYLPGKNIEFGVGSKASHGLGQNIFCLAGDTEILVKGEEGKVLSKPIELLTKDSVKVMVYNYLTKECGWSINEHYSIPTLLTDELYEIKLEDGTIIRGNGDHKILLSNGEYKKLEDIKIGDDLIEVDKGE